MSSSKDWAEDWRAALARLERGRFKEGEEDWYAEPALSPAQEAAQEEGERAYWEALHAARRGPGPEHEEDAIGRGRERDVCADCGAVWGAEGELTSPGDGSCAESYADWCAALEEGRQERMRER